MINSQLLDYRRKYPEDAALVDDFLGFLRSVPNPFSRECIVGHLTGSAVILDKSCCSVVLIHHKKLDKWFQPGGHADGNEDLEFVARKEALEETGLAVLLPMKAPIVGLSIHTIPAYKSDPAHLHYDVRFGFISEQTRLVLSDESHAVNWFAFDDKVMESELREHVQRAKQAFDSIVSASR